MGILDKHSFLRKQVITVFVISTISVVFSSCAISDNVVATHNSDQPARSHHLSHVGKTHWSFFWGLLKQNDWNAGCQEGSNMSKVRVKTNAGFIVISFLSAGIAVPQRLEWDCSPPCRSTGTIGH